MTPAAMHIMRMALFTSVAAIGLVAYLLSRAGNPPPLDEAIVPLFGYAFYGFAAVALFAIVILRGAATQPGPIAKRGALTLAAWAVAEGVAIFGGVLWILTGAPAPYAAGAALFAITAFTVPIPDVQDG